MQVDLRRFLSPSDTVAVAVSGGSDSMALLHYMQSQAEKYRFFVVALNVEHGIRGESSISDTEFVKEYCKKNSIPLLCYSVDSIKKATEEKMSVEQAARSLRYECFNDAIKKGKCNLVATAHHSRDNLESVLFNLFRGTGLKGAAGIEENFNGKIIRPFLGVNKDEIEKYVECHKIPYVTDPTNLLDDYTRNYIRLNILPEIKKIFPDAEKSITRFSELLRTDNAYLDSLATATVIGSNDGYKIPIQTDKALFGRAIIYALKRLGIKKDWEKSHIDSVLLLITAKNGCSINLKQGIVAIREYDYITLYNSNKSSLSPIPFKTGETVLLNQVIDICPVKKPVDLKDGFYCDGDKIPATAQIRFKKDGDRFTKFGGGTKSLNDYLTDKKIPLRLRDTIPLIVDGQTVLAVVGVAISEKIKVDETTVKIYKINKRGSI